MPVDRLEGPCGVCGRVAGDHTLREWAACVGAVTTDLPFEPIGDEATARAAQESVRRQFELDEDLIVADHVVVRSMTLAGGLGGGVGVRFPALLHEFQVGVAGSPPVAVAKVLFAADVVGVRKYGRLVRDSANGAANAVERGGA